MTIYNEPPYSCEAVLFEIPELSRENLTLVSGAGLVKAGTVLGQITASGKYTPYDDGFSDGSETAAAISLYEVDATAADVEVACIARLAAVQTAALQWHANVDATAQTAAYTALAAKTILARS
ncbi:MAG: head decoration protein [Gammaproteobacteria bacterium]|nr:head decoration protein [Gammaproteobacteria bacterium]